MSEWKEYKFSEFVDINPSVPLNGKSLFSYVEMKDLQDGNKYCFPSAERNPASGSRFRNGDTLFAKITPCLENGKICQVKGLKNGIGFGSTEFLVFRGKEGVSNNDFVFYLSRWEEVRAFAENNFEGTSGRQRVPKGCFENLFLNLPEIPEQTAIASVLSSLDDKIDLLHRQNKTLEQMAETLFRQWFVEEAEEDWKETSLRDIADHYKEGINPSSFPETVFNHFSLPAFDEGKSPKTEIGKDILSNKYKVLPNSIIISKLNPRFPRIWELFGDEIPDNSICSTEFQIVKPKNIAYFGFIYCFLKSNPIVQELANAASGTSGSHQRVTPDDIFNLDFLEPPIERIKEFDSITKQYFGKIKSHTKQIKTLTQLRDTLLPKLMSGEVRVKMN